MGAEALRPRSGSDVVRVCFSFHCLLRIVLQRTGDKLGGVAHRHGAQVVVVLMHILCIGKVTKDLSDQILLLFRCRKILFAVVDFIHALAGGNIFEISSGLFPRLYEFEFGYELRHYITYAFFGKTACGFRATASDFYLSDSFYAVAVILSASRPRHRRRESRSAV